jgi:hypothetical protein
VGFSHSWIAVQGLTPERALEALGMEVSDVKTDLLEGVSLFDWRDDWLVLVSDDYQSALGGELAELGPLGVSAVAYGASEEALYWRACGYEDGSDIWSITVNPAKQIFRVIGFPPEDLDSLLAHANAAQAEGKDLFTAIPGVLAESICGFALHGDLSAIGHVSLKSTGRPRQPTVRASGKPGFLARLFGRS